MQPIVANNQEERDAKGACATWNRGIWGPPGRGGGARSRAFGSPFARDPARAGAPGRGRWCGNGPKEACGEPIRGEKRVGHHLFRGIGWPDEPGIAADGPRQRKARTDCPQSRRAQLRIDAREPQAARPTAPSVKAATPAAPRRTATPPRPREPRNRRRPPRGTRRAPPSPCEQPDVAWPAIEALGREGQPIARVSFESRRRLPSDAVRVTALKRRALRSIPTPSAAGSSARPRARATSTPSGASSASITRASSIDGRPRAQARSSARKCSLTGPAPTSSRSVILPSPSSWGANGSKAEMPPAPRSGSTARSPGRPAFPRPFGAAPMPRSRKTTTSLRCPSRTSCPRAIRSARRFAAMRSSASRSAPRASNVPPRCRAARRRREGRTAAAIRTGGADGTSCAGHRARRRTSRRSTANPRPESAEGMPRRRTAAKCGSIPPRLDRPLASLLNKKKAAKAYTTAFPGSRGARAETYGGIGAAGTPQARVAPRSATRPAIPGYRDDGARGKTVDAGTASTSSRCCISASIACMSMRAFPPRANCWGPRRRPLHRRRRARSWPISGSLGSSCASSTRSRSGPRWGPAPAAEPSPRAPRPCSKSQEPMTGANTPPRQARRRCVNRCFRSPE